MIYLLHNNSDGASIRKKRLKFDGAKHVIRK